MPLCGSMPASPGDSLTTYEDDQMRRMCQHQSAGTRTVGMAYGHCCRFGSNKRFVNLLRQPSMQRCTAHTWTRACTFRHRSARSRACFYTISANNSSVAPPEEHYIDQVKGKRFSCTECGKCCTGKGEIWLNSRDISRIADRLNIKTASFISGYTKAYSRAAGFRLLRSQRNATQVPSKPSA